MKDFFTKEVVTSLVVLLVGLFIYFITKVIIRKLFNFKKMDSKKRTIINLIVNIIRFIILLITGFIILEVNGIDTKSLLASFGVAGLVAGLALQDLLKDFIVGMSLIFEGEFAIGDWVSINGFKGEVLPSNLRITKLRSATGEVKMISNRTITEVVNYSMYNTNLMLDIDVAYESDIKKVKDVLDKLCEKFKTEHDLKEIKCDGIQELASSSIKFRVTVTCKFLDQFTLGRFLKKEIVTEFKKHNITIPYNQVVVHNG